VWLIVTHQVDGSIDKAKAFATSSELKAAMAKAGVASAPEIHFVANVAHSQP
jgi:hypothetical protein